MAKNTSLGGKNGPKVSILLHDIRSVHNVGSVFRTADAFGVSKIYISGYTPSPKDRFGRMRADIAKVALGAEQMVPWEVVEGSVADFVKGWKKTGAKVVVLEQDARSVSLNDAREKILGNVAAGAVEILLIPGNEVGGVECDLLDLADIIAEIPMNGKKESLNVSVSVGIALFGLSVF
jgi:tRNA G18 (ribose-2'-O)-methylase SpoU